IECPSLMRMGEEQPPPTRPSGPWRGLITYLRVSDPTFCVMKCAPDRAPQHEYRTTSIRTLTCIAQVLCTWSRNCGDWSAASLPPGRAATPAPWAPGRGQIDDHRDVAVIAGSAGV